MPLGGCSTRSTGSGRFQVSSTIIDGRLAVRLAFLSQRTTEREVDEAVALIGRTAAG
jgi:hypothetical protein